MITLNTLSISDYNKLIARLLGNFEGDHNTPYFDSKSPNKHVTIGRGFDIEPEGISRDAVFKVMGLNNESIRVPDNPAQQAALRARNTSYITKITNVLKSRDTTNAKLQNSLNQIMAERAADPAFASLSFITSRTTFSLSNAEIESVFSVIIEEKEKVIDRRISNRSTFTLSTERAVLVAMAFQGIVPSRSIPLKAAIITNSNRAEAWFQIRYKGYIGANDGPGQSKRHYIEAEKFGLYNDPQNISLDEAKQIFRMLQVHRQDIFDYEALHGPGGSVKSSSGRTGFEEANFNGANGARTLNQSLDSAWIIFFPWLKTQYPQIKGTAADYKPTDILYGVPGLIALKDVDLAIDGTEPPASKVIVGDENKHNQLQGGKGNDVVIGGSKFDTYLFGSGSGNDQILDPNKSGRIVIETNLLNKIRRESLKFMFKSGTYSGNVWKDATGTNSATKNSPLKILLEDGSIIELGEDFQSGDFGIHLLDMPNTPQTTKTIVGDLTPIDSDFDEDGVQMELNALGNVICSLDPKPGRSDYLKDGSGNERIEGRDGNDFIYQGLGDDWILGGNGRDGIGFKEGELSNNDVIEGGADADVLYGGDGDDQLFGEDYGEMADLIEAGESAESIDERGNLIGGADGNDFIYGAERNDALFGGKGHDLIVAGAGDDFISSAGDYNGTFFTWKLNNGTYSYEIGPVFDWTCTIGQNGSILQPVFTGLTSYDMGTENTDDDVVYAGAGNDFVYTAGGNDQVYAGSGNDTVFGWGGNDDIFGGDGDDILVGDNDTSILSVEKHGDDYIDGGDGDDRIFGNGGSDDLFGGDGDDEISGGDGDDYVEEAVGSGLQDCKFL